MTTPQPDTTAAGSEARLATLSVLRAHWNAAQQGYVDLFVPFAVEVAEADTRTAIPVSDIVRVLEERFGFEVPEGAVRTILGRAQRQGYGRLRRREFEVSEKASAEFAASDDERAT